MDFNFKPLATVGLLPDGEYLVYCEKCELKTTRDGAGQYLAATFKVHEGEHADRTLPMMYNISNRNPEAERIGHTELTKLCQAIGLKSVNKTQELEYKFLKITVATKARKDNGEDQNVIKKYTKADVSDIAVPRPVDEFSSTKSPW